MIFLDDISGRFEKQQKKLTLFCCLTMGLRLNTVIDEALVRVNGNHHAALEHVHRLIGTIHHHRDAHRLAGHGRVALRVGALHDDGARAAHIGQHLAGGHLGDDDVAILKVALQIAERVDGADVAARAAAAHAFAAQEHVADDVRLDEVGRAGNAGRHARGDDDHVAGLDQPALLRRFDGVVVLDEAYIDFAEGQGFLPRIDEFPNLIVLQTLSKAWGMAGLRLGLAFASERIAALFGQVKYPYNINTLTQQTAAECLRRDIAAQIAQIREERGRLAAALAGCGCIERVYPSQANFLLVKTADPDRLYGELIAAGVIVRNRTRLTGCEGCLRITVGTPAENGRMLETVKNFRP